MPSRFSAFLAISSNSSSGGVISDYCIVTHL
jgi:hypothetical protein